MMYKQALYTKNINFMKITEEPYLNGEIHMLLETSWIGAFPIIFYIIFPWYECNLIKFQQKSQ